MKKQPVAATIAAIAKRERTLAVEEGDYLWAFICAVVEYHADQAAESRS